MQKLLRRRLTDTPGNASQVPCSVDLSLNREATLSQLPKAKALGFLLRGFSVNLPEEYTQGLKANYVYVLSIEG